MHNLLILNSLVKSFSMLIIRLVHRLCYYNIAPTMIEHSGIVLSTGILLGVFVSPGFRGN